jgi:hypothetical protein
MLRRVVLLWTDVSDERSASIRLTRIGELRTTLAVTSYRRTLRRRTMCSVRRLLVAANVVASSPIHVTLMIEALRSSEASVHTRATRRNILEDGIVHCTINFATSNLYCFIYIAYDENSADIQELKSWSSNIFKSPSLIRRSTLWVRFRHSKTKLPDSVVIT